MDKTVVSQSGDLRNNSDPLLGFLGPMGYLAK